MRPIRLAVAALAAATLLGGLALPADAGLFRRRAVRRAARAPHHACRPPVVFGHPPAPAGSYPPAFAEVCPPTGGYGGCAGGSCPR